MRLVAGGAFAHVLGELRFQMLAVFGAWNYTAPLLLFPFAPFHRREVLQRVPLSASGRFMRGSNHSFVFLVIQ